MKYHYLVMEREYGSGATQIGRRLSEILGIPCYGREILEKVAGKGHISAEQIEAYEEKATNSFLYSVYLMSRMDTGEANLASAESNIYLAEQRVIKELAASGPCILIGHCAAQALKDKKGLCRVFIHADRQTRLRRAVEEYGIPQADAARVLKKYDRKRENYYKANTSADWKDPDEYDMMLNSARMGTDGCIEILKGFYSPED